ncbi:MAG: hypothetical protein IH846_06150 [Acidobacteria bacterium]|nr:hypothetical protein [Acidobacteriota bacterium]
MSSQSIMLIAVVVQGVATVAIACFAYTTWRATRLDSKVAYLSFAAHLIGKAKGQAQGEYWQRLFGIFLGILGEELPKKELEKLEPYFSELSKT